MARDYRERHSETGGAWISSWKREKWKMDERRLGSLFQTVEATDENDLDFAIPFFRLGTHSDNEDEDRYDRVGTYRGIRAAR